jgi:hypothetical protein
MRHASTVVIIGSVTFASLASCAAYWKLIHHPADSSGHTAHQAEPQSGVGSPAQPEAMGETTTPVSSASAEEMRLVRLAPRQQTAGSGFPSPAEAIVYQQAFRERMDAVEAAFRSEATDQDWSTKVGAELSAYFRKHKAFRTVRSIECRSKTCRIEVSDDGHGAISGELPILTLRFAETLPAMQVDRAKGKGGEDTLILYMSSSTS